MPRIHHILFAFSALSLFTVTPAIAQTATPPEVPGQSVNEILKSEFLRLPSEEFPFANLLSPSEREREKATDRILRANGSIDLILLGCLDSLLKDFPQKWELPKNSDRFDGPFYNLMWAIASTDAKSTESRLYSIYDYQLDPGSTPIARTPQPLEYYPAAYALSHIGNNRTVEYIFNGLYRPFPDVQRRLQASILKGILGKELALLLVEKRLKDEENRLKQRNETTSIKKVNLEAFKALFESNESLLRTPTSKDLSFKDMHYGWY